MYLNEAGYEAAAFTTTVYSRAPRSSRASTTSAIVEPFCPMATYTHLTCFFGSPLLQSSSWLMIASMAMAVLPVFWSPMISSRWPRPIGVMPSMALMPVWRGSFTGWRWTTEGAWISRTRKPSSLIGPLSSSGRPSGSTTRPRSPSPIGTERIRPVCLTGAPSSISAPSPRITTPIVSMSRFRATPGIPFGNSSSSFAMARGRPSTMATPSPVETTRPTSSRSIEGS